MSPYLTAQGTAAQLNARPPRHLIDGQTVTSPERFDVIDPATGEPVARCFSAGLEQLNGAVAAARRAQPSWAGLPMEARRRHLADMADTLLENRDELAALITLEQGKPLAKAREEVQGAAAQVGRVTSIELGRRVLREDANGRIELHYLPLGVVGAIAPWNMPLVLSVPKITHGLYTGNTVVLKPSPYTPMATLRLGELLKDTFPPGVLNIVAGGDELGRWISEHPGIDKISFTGSTATGRRVMASSAGNLKRLTLEMGGNDAAIVLDDVDVEAVAERIFAAAFVNSGQICMSIKRLYVHDAVHDRLAQALARLARDARVGDGFSPGVEIGPVQNRAQFDIVSGILEDTRRIGARFLAGGRAMSRQGYFFEPTIVVDVPETARLVVEEPFGPVLPIMRFTDVDDAVRRANDTHYGLGGSVWSSDVERAAAIASRLEVGTAWVNSHVGADAFVPFGGVKQSGIGRKYGVEGLHDHMDMRAVFIPSPVAGP